MRHFQHVSTKIGEILKIGLKVLILTKYLSTSPQEQVPTYFKFEKIFSVLKLYIKDYWTGPVKYNKLFLSHDMQVTLDMFCSEISKHISFCTLYKLIAYCVMFGTAWWESKEKTLVSSKMINGW